MRFGSHFLHRPQLAGATDTAHHHQQHVDSVLPLEATSLKKEDRPHHTRSAKGMRYAENAAVSSGAKKGPISLIRLQCKVISRGTTSRGIDKLHLQGIGTKEGSRTSVLAVLNFGFLIQL